MPRQERSARVQRTWVLAPAVTATKPYRFARGSLPTQENSDLIKASQKPNRQRSSSPTFGATEGMRKRHSQKADITPPPAVSATAVANRKSTVSPIARRSGDSLPVKTSVSNRRSGDSLPVKASVSTRRSGDSLPVKASVSTGRSGDSLPVKASVSTGRSGDSLPVKASVSTGRSGDSLPAKASVNIWKSGDSLPVKASVSSSNRRFPAAVIATVTTATVAPKAKPQWLSSTSKNWRITAIKPARQDAASKAKAFAKKSKTELHSMTTKESSVDPPKFVPAIAAMTMAALIPVISPKIKGNLSPKIKGNLSPKGKSANFNTSAKQSSESLETDAFNATALSPENNLSVLSPPKALTSPEAAISPAKYSPFPVSKTAFEYPPEENMGKKTPSPPKAAVVRSRSPSSSKTPLLSSSDVNIVWTENENSSPAKSAGSPPTEIEKVKTPSADSDVLKPTTTTGKSILPIPPTKIHIFPVMPSHPEASAQSEAPPSGVISAFQRLMRSPSSEAKNEAPFHSPKKGMFLQMPSFPLKNKQVSSISPPSKPAPNAKGNKNSNETSPATANEPSSSAQNQTTTPEKETTAQTKATSPAKKSPAFGRSPSHPLLKRSPSLRVAPAEDAYTPPIPPTIIVTSSPSSGPKPRNQEPTPLGTSIMNPTMSPPKSVSKQQESPPRGTSTVIKSTSPPGSLYKQPESPPRGTPIATKPTSPPKSVYKQDSPPRGTPTVNKSTSPPKSVHKQGDSTSPPRETPVVIMSESPPKSANKQEDKASPPRGTPVFIKSSATPKSVFKGQNREPTPGGTVASKTTTSPPKPEYKRPNKASTSSPFAKRATEQARVAANPEAQSAATQTTPADAGTTSATLEEKQKEDQKQMPDASEANVPAAPSTEGTQKASPTISFPFLMPSRSFFSQMATSVAFGTALGRKLSGIFKVSERDEKKSPIVAPPSASAQQQPEVGAPPLTNTQQQPETGTPPMAIAQQEPETGTPPMAIAQQQPGTGASPVAIAQQQPATGAPPMANVQQQPGTMAPPMATAQQQPGIGAAPLNLQETSNNSPLACIPQLTSSGQAPVPKTQQKQVFDDVQWLMETSLLL